jgi:hypothetical protein
MARITHSLLLWWCPALGQKAAAEREKVCGPRCALDCAVVFDAGAAACSHQEMKRTSQQVQELSQQKLALESLASSKDTSLRDCESKLVSARVVPLGLSRQV